MISKCTLHYKATIPLSNNATTQGFLHARMESHSQLIRLQHFKLISMLYRTKQCHLLQSRPYDTHAIKLSRHHGALNPSLGSGRGQVQHMRMDNLDTPFGQHKATIQTCSLTTIRLPDVPRASYGELYAHPLPACMATVRTPRPRCAGTLCPRRPARPTTPDRW